MSPDAPAPGVSKSLRDRGIVALKAGDKSLARELLLQAVGVDPVDEYAWLWLSEAVTSSAERQYCLGRVLAINPRNETARRALQRMRPVVPSAPHPSAQPGLSAGATAYQERVQPAAAAPSGPASAPAAAPPAPAAPATGAAAQPASQRETDRAASPARPATATSAAAPAPPGAEPRPAPSAAGMEPRSAPETPIASSRPERRPAPATTAAARPPERPVTPGSAGVASRMERPATPAGAPATTRPPAPVTAEPTAAPATIESATPARASGRLAAALQRRAQQPATEAPAPESAQPASSAPVTEPGRRSTLSRLSRIGDLLIEVPLVLGVLQTIVIVELGVYALSSRYSVPSPLLSILSILVGALSIIYFADRLRHHGLRREDRLAARLKKRDAKFFGAVERSTASLLTEEVH